MHSVQLNSIKSQAINLVGLSKTLNSFAKKPLFQYSPASIVCLCVCMLPGLVYEWMVLAVVYTNVFGVFCLALSSGRCIFVRFRISIQYKEWSG